MSAPAKSSAYQKNCGVPVVWKRRMPCQSSSWSRLESADVVPSQPPVTLFPAIVGLLAHRERPTHLRGPASRSPPASMRAICSEWRRLRIAICPSSTAHYPALLIRLPKQKIRAHMGAAELKEARRPNDKSWRAPLNCTQIERN